MNFIFLLSVLINFINIKIVKACINNINIDNSIFNTISSMFLLNKIVHKYIDIYSVNIDIVNAIIVIKVDFNRLIFNINFSININKIHITRVLTNGIFKYNFISEVIPMLKNEHINNINVLFFEMFSIFPIILDKFPNK